MGFQRGASGRESACNADLGSIPGSGKSPGGRHGNTLQYSCLENPMDRRAWLSRLPCNIPTLGQKFKIPALKTNQQIIFSSSFFHSFLFYLSLCLFLLIIQVLQENTILPPSSLPPSLLFFLPSTGSRGIHTFVLLLVFYCLENHLCPEVDKQIFIYISIHLLTRECTETHIHFVPYI